MEFYLSSTNNNMKKCLTKIHKMKSKPLLIDLIKFLNLINSPFINKDGRILLQEIANLDSYFELNDKTGSECEENHIHISDFIESKNRGLVLLEIGLKFAKLLSERLKCTYPRYHFNVIISYDLKNLSNLNDCIVRFHKVRLGERWLTKNLEDYKQHAIGIIET